MQIMKKGQVHESINILKQPGRANFRTGPLSIPH
jgi:hypothetical protein